MIYLTNDALDQAVYFEKRNGRALRSGNGCHFGVVGNGTFETAVTLKGGRDRVEIVFGKSSLFIFVEEDLVRRLLAELAAGETVH